MNVSGLELDAALCGRGLLMFRRNLLLLNGSTIPVPDYTASDDSSLHSDEAYYHVIGGCKFNCWLAQRSLLTGFLQAGGGGDSQRSVPVEEAVYADTDVVRVLGKILQKSSHN
jgi:hypothetical protein